MCSSQSQEIAPFAIFTHNKKAGSFRHRPSYSSAPADGSAARFEPLAGIVVAAIALAQPAVTPDAPIAAAVNAIVGIGTVRIGDDGGRRDADGHTGHDARAPPPCFSRGVEERNEGGESRNRCDESAGPTLH
jgi:hypothetical protein